MLLTTIFLTLGSFLASTDGAALQSRASPPPPSPSPLHLLAGKALMLHDPHGNSHSTGDAHCQTGGREIGGQGHALVPELALRSPAQHRPVLGAA